MHKNVSKDEWVALFRETGLDDDQMHKWHQLFESRHPEGHQSFLEWLGLPDQEVEKIRAQFR
jgi:hypothetical protein